MKVPEAFSMETASAVFIRRACDTTVSCVSGMKTRMKDFGTGPANENAGGIFNGNRIRGFYQGGHVTRQSHVCFIVR